MRSTSQQIRSELGHPVIDGDGHVQEYLPAVHALSSGRSWARRCSSTTSDRPTPLGGMVKRAGARTRTPQSAWWGRRPATPGTWPRR